MPKLVDRVSYRKQLLAQCLDLFAHYGYGALTMRQIADALQVSTGTLYHYFPTKEALFQQLVEDVTRQTIFEASTTIQQDIAPEERLLGLFHFIAQHEDTLRKQFLIMLNYYQRRDLYGDTAETILKEGAARYRRAIMALLDWDDPQLCFMLQSQINGLLMLRMMNGATLPFMEQTSAFVDMLIDYLQKRTGSKEPV